MPEDLDFMVTRGMGPVRRFRISFRILVGASVFLLLFLLASVLVINQYFDNRFLMRSQALELARLEDELGETKRALYRSGQRIAVLETHLQRVGSTERGIDEPPETTDRPPAGPSVSAPGRPVASGSPASPSKVDIEDVTTRQAEGRLTFSFKVVNRGDDEEPIRGYVHVIAVEGASNPPQLWTYPKTAFKDGLPVNYKLGHLFSIRRFREIRGECFLDPEDRVPTLLKILVYDVSGTLICRREFPLKPAS